jgi:hypothetical protein
MTFQTCFYSECGCNQEGVEDGDMNCDKDGKCNCKCNVYGDKCNECNAEYFGFPVCHGMSYDEHS